MNFKEIFKQAFDCVSPVSNDEEIFKGVMERTENMNTKRKIKLKKPVFAVLAAVTAVAAATVTAGAATGWNFNGAFDSIFRQRTEWMETMPELQEYKSGFDFSKYGKELDLHYSFDSYTLNINGVIADESTAYVVYEVIFDESYDYKEKKGYTPWEMTAILETADLAMNTNDDGLIAADDNRFMFYKMATSGKEDKPLIGNTLVLDFYRLSRGIENSIECDELYSEEQTLDCGLTVEIPVDFPIYNAKEYTVDEKAYLIDYKGGEKFEVEAELETISVSPLSCNFSFMTEISAELLSKGGCYCLDDFYFTDKSGNEIIFANNSYMVDVEDNGRMRYHVHLNQPIEPDNIASITVGGITIELN